jgi:hypothetical protein
MKPEKIILWGYPLHSHTHSYIHYAFKRAFDYLGCETYWFTDKDDVSGFNFNNCLFITGGDQEQNIPLNKSSRYVIHNVNAKKYLDQNCKIFLIQTHTKDAPLDTNPNSHRINPWSLLHTDNDIKCLYMAWATDLLPNEINLNNATNQNHNRECVWVGTSGGGNSKFENGSALYPYFEECKKNNIIVNNIDPWATPVSPEKNLLLVKNSFVSPSIQGPWQVESQYIPCRIFKNISYGHFGITNNSYVNRIFNNQLIYDSNSTTLFYKSLEAKQSSGAVDYIKSLMQEVKNNHTYINRIQVLFDCMGLEL